METTERGQGKRRGLAGLHTLTLSLSFLVCVLGTVQPGAPVLDGQEAKRIFSRANPEDFKGNEFCADCHTDIVKNFSASGHAAFMTDSHLPADHRGCEGCHGAGGIHQADKDPEVVSFTSFSPKESSAACLRCH